MNTRENIETVRADTDAVDLYNAFLQATNDARDTCEITAEGLERHIVELQAGTPATRENIGKVRRLIGELQKELVDADSRLVDLAASLDPEA